MLSEEPNSKMEELLRAYTKKRREQAEPALQMHPATRKLLQDEVKRTLGAAPPPPRQSWRTLRWPLLAMGCGFAALMVMFAVINTQMRHLLPATAPVADKSQTVFAAHALPASASDGAGVAAGEFIQIHDRAQEQAAQSPLSNILSVFRLRRSGQNVRIVDADGSVYDGQVRSGISGRARYGMAKTRKDANEDMNWSFKVMGTNNHLQQTIVFTGNVLAMPAATPLNNAAARNRSASQLQNAPAGAFVPSAQNSRITGKVQVGGGKEFEIEAKPPAP
jgi:hypothetical protein